MYRNPNGSMLFHPIGAVERRNLRLIVGVHFEGGSQERKDPVDCCPSLPADGANRQESRKSGWCSFQPGTI